MGIPQLSTCCCGCSLKTGTKIIGWLSLIGSILTVIAAASGLAALYYIEDHPENVSPDAKEIREHLPALKAVAIFMIVINLLVCALSFILLLGAYQNKAKFLLIWIVVSLTVILIEQAINIVQAFTLYQPANLINFVVFLIDLYFILVVYSFYREIRNVSTNYA